jgi:RNA polymerase sigma-70 factor (ECF subfamily)
MLTDEQRRRLGEWIAAVGPRALAYARSLTRDEARAEDVVQDCLYRLLRKADDYDLERDGVKLLFRAVSNQCINQATREKALVSLDAVGDPDDGPLPVADRATPDPADVAQSRELEAAVRDALGKLPPLQRAAVELRALGMSKEEIAEALQVSAVNAGVLVHRGRRAMQRELGEIFGGEAGEKNV